MDGISLNSRLMSMRSSTEILKTVLPEKYDEPGAYPLVTGPGFDLFKESFTATVSRMILDKRAEEAKALSLSPAKAAGPQKPDLAKVITINKADVKRVWGGSDNDQINISANRVDFVHGMDGDDLIHVKAVGDNKVTSGINALDSGSVTNINGGAGNDTIIVEAEEMASNITGEQGDNTILVAANYATKISAGGGKDTFKIEAHVVENVNGNGGDDDIDITATKEEGLDERQTNSTRQGSVENIDGGYGNDKINIRADRLVMNVQGGAGNDTLAISASEIYCVDAGSGNDTIKLQGSTVEQVDAGSGNDQVNIAVDYAVFISAGDGNDNVAIQSQYAVMIDLGQGNDSLFINASSVADIYGGAGNDRIDIVSDNRVSNIYGDDGNDTISIKAQSIQDISGGRGNDTISLLQSSSDGIRLHMAEGDGQDTLTVNSDLEIVRYSADGTTELGLSGAKLEKIGTDKYKLTFAKSTDSITINYFEPGRKSGTFNAKIDGNRIVLA